MMVITLVMLMLKKQRPASLIEGNILVSGQSVSPPEEEFKLDIDKLMDNNSNMFIGAFIGIIIMIVIMKGGEYVLKSAPKIVLGDK